MEIFDHTQPVKKDQHFRSVAGILLILTGGVLFIDQYLKTGWLSLMIMPVLGLFFYLWGIRYRHNNQIVLGGVLAGVGVGVAYALLPAYQSPVLLHQIGRLAGFTGIGWLMVVLGTAFFTNKPAWWALVPGGGLLGFGACALTTSFIWYDIVLYLTLGIGLPLLLWGLSSRLFGLIIPGSLLVGIGPGIYFSWGIPREPNWLVQVGMMLVWFAFGWLLITLFSRILFHRFVWWPLIPGGILAVVGWGLYIGGDPDNAAGFISNTGAIGLMIFGLYLLLMRKGIHNE